MSFNPNDNPLKDVQIMGITTKSTLTTFKAKHTFEDFLSEKHAEGYMGLDDDMPDAFDHWLGELDSGEVMDFAHEYSQKLLDQFLPLVEATVTPDEEDGAPDASSYSNGWNACLHNLRENFTNLRRS